MEFETKGGMTWADSQQLTQLHILHCYEFLVGVLPNTLVTVQAGVTLAALASPDDFTLLTPENIIMTIVICICLLIPIILHRHAEDPNADPETDEEQETLARV